MTVFVAVAVTVTAVSCIDKVQNYDAERVITFKALRAESTKSGARGIADSASFKVWGYTLPEKKNWSDDFGKSSAVFEGETFSCSGGYWKSVSDYLWCDKNSRMSFFAIAPADANVTFSKDKGITITGFKAENPLESSQPSVEFATLCDVRKPVADAAIGIAFSNALCEVEFWAKSVATDDIKLTVTKLILSDVGTEGDFHSLPEPEWTISGDRKDVTVFEGNVVLGEEAKALGTVLTMIPQNLKPHITLQYSFDSGTGGEIKDVDVEIDRTMKWAVGKKRIYTFKVSQNLALTIDSCVTENSL